MAKCIHCHSKFHIPCLLQHLTTKETTPGWGKHKCFRASETCMDQNITGIEIWKNCRGNYDSENIFMVVYP